MYLEVWYQRAIFMHKSLFVIFGCAGSDFWLRLRAWAVAVPQHNMLKFILSIYVCAIIHTSLTKLLLMQCNYTRLLLVRHRHSAAGVLFRLMAASCIENPEINSEGV